MADSSTSSEGPRPFTLTDQDHRGLFVVTAALCMTYSFLIVTTRLTATSHNLSFDDWFSIGATVLAMPQFISILIGVSEGLGLTFLNITGADADSIGRCWLASDVFFILALFLAKISVIHLCQRLFATSQHGKRLLCHILTAICSVWCVASVVAVLTDCGPLEVIGYDHICTGLEQRWITIGSFDALTEILILSIAITLVWPLHMKSSLKVQALSCFIPRSGLLVFIGLHLSGLHTFVTSSNPGPSLSRPSIYRQTELCYSLLSAAIPTLNKWLRKFDTNQAATFGYNPGTYGNLSYQMSTLHSQTAGRSKVDHTKDNKEEAESIVLPMDRPTSALPKWRSTEHSPSEGQYAYAIEHGKQRSYNDGTSNTSLDDNHSGRHNSEEMIIRKHIGYEISYEVK